jgi:D-aminopeptidase
MTVLPDGLINPLFEAACEAVREAIYNSMTMAESVTGRGGRKAHGIDLQIIL